MRKHQIAAMGVLAACAVAASPAGAVQQPTHLPSGLELASGAPARAQRTVSMQVPRSARGAWLRFRGDVGGSWVASWDEATGVPSRIFGSGIHAPGSVASDKLALGFAKSFLERHLALLAPGASIDDFAAASNDLHRGMRTVSFVQHAGGLRVLGGQVSFRFKNDHLIVIASEALPAVPARVAPATADPAALKAAARSWIEHDFGPAVGAVELEGPFVLPLIGRASILDYRVVMRATVHTQSPIARFSVFVDPDSGAVVAREQTLRFATGTVLFNAPVRRPTSDRADYPAASLNVNVGGNMTTTDALGVLTFPDPGPAAIDLGVVGPRVRVLNDAGPEATTTLSLAASGSATWDESASAVRDAQLSGYVHALIAKDQAAVLAPQMQGFLNQQLTVNVNINDTCNAFYDGTSINFFRASGQCENTGRLADVVYHEFGHAFHHRSILLGSGDFDEALSEGVSDYYSAAITGDPGMGRGFYYTNQPLRHIDPSQGEYVWPDDIHPDTHQTGLIIAGALWDLRKLLITKLGDTPGADKTNELFAQSIRNAVDIPSMYAEMLAADDNDGNLANGTPNACEIAEAFGAHGLRMINVAGSDLDVAPPELDGYELTVRVEGLFPQCPNDSVSGAEIAWKLRDDDGPINTMTMTGGPAEFHGEIPKASPGQVVNYRVDVQLGSGEQMSFPNNPADPMYELFVGDVTEIYCTDFEADPEPAGWTHGLLAGNNTEGADDWQWGTPAGNAQNGDPSEAYSGTMVFGNDLGHGNYNGLYQPNKTNYADSPVIDVGAFENVRLQYRRWLQVEDGYYDQARIYANGHLAWDNLASPTENATTHHQDREWRFQDVDLSSYVSPEGTVQVRFELQTDGGLQMGGWTIDDFCIVAYEGPPPSETICGNGIVELLETCDDGNLEPGDGCDATCQLEEDNNTEPTDASPFVVDSGCGCRVAGAGGQRLPWPLALLGLSVLGLRRRSGRK